MKIRLLILFCLLFFGFAQSQTLTPEVFAVSGDYFQQTNSSLSWTIGEEISETFANTSSILTQGFQQPEPSPLSVDQIDDEFYCNIFPNPTKDMINISIKSNVIQKLNIKLMDIYGRLYYDKNFETSELTEQIELKKYRTGTFFIRISDENDKVLKSVVIIKIN